MQKEIWKNIDGFPKYQVSTLGNVMNIEQNKKLNPTKKGGYYLVDLRNEGERKSYRVHRLVAGAFLENPDNKSDVNHKDKNKLNNCLLNLEWNTRKENMIHAKTNTSIATNTNRNKIIFRIDSKTNEILEKYNSIEHAGIWAFENGLTKTSHNGRNAIGNCIQCRSESAYGYIWEPENKNEDIEGEIWKSVVVDKIDVEKIDSSKKYFVSTLGRFKNSCGIIMKNYKINENGYIRVFIYCKTFALHRLVALAFLDNSGNKEQVNHKDGNKLNNTVSNLEWCTNQENQIHKVQIGLGNNFTRKIIQYDILGNEIKKFDSIVGASKELNIGRSNICGVLTNYRKTAGGFIFKYFND